MWLNQLSSATFVQYFKRCFGRKKKNLVKLLKIDVFVRVCIQTLTYVTMCVCTYTELANYLFT